MQCLDGHIPTYFNKDARDLVMLSIVLMGQLYRVDFLSLFVVRLFLHLLFDLCFLSILLIFIVHCSLFKEKSFNSDPGLYSRYFDPIQEPVVREVPVHHHLYKSINIIHQTAPTLS